MSIKLLSFDIDGTLLGNPDTNYPFSKIWQRVQADDKPLLCLNTGRLLDETLGLVRAGQLPKPDYIISGVGTSIYDFGKKQVIKAFSEILEEGWNLETVDGVINRHGDGLVKQPAHFQNPYKSSWYFENATDEQIAAIQHELEAAGLDVNVVYSSNLHFDVLPKWANKGNALSWLLKHLEIPAEDVIVAGDTGNDSAMFLVRDVRGIIVANAQPELFEAAKELPVYIAERKSNEGVLEGLVYYEVLPDTVFEIDPDISGVVIDPHLVQYLGDEAQTDIDEEQMAFIRVGYEKAIEAIRKNITPLGFSACSLTDNDSLGTDENYRSVWARDGSLAIVGTIPLLGDEEIRTCQQRTMETLLGHITPNGQIPANVRIDDQRPDYSGVGGICSIDSGLWLIIAFYEYARASRDLDFVRRYMGPLQSVMNWLSAHDGNNDALLEIPEAGDWTDLFGRSYNVLYDEVLWYRANICFGRLLELVGDSQRAGDYLRWSQVIKKEILRNFWPSTELNMYQNVSFDEQQYSLGDA
ncbi:MAG: HAD-IIB family hydrolase, partial [Anaerolineae bacterium]|nr:HAD-IIB family hydrolase [Anaerolineae bacterium]